MSLSGNQNNAENQRRFHISEEIGKYIVVLGNPIDRLTIYGDFDNHDKAIDWATNHSDDHDWWIVPVWDKNAT